MEREKEKREKREKRIYCDCAGAIAISRAFPGSFSFLVSLKYGS